MPKIHLLSPEIISQIAAGEVIERPSFAIKELIENALDAHAKNIIIELHEAGIKEIKITDDGDGLEKDDLALALLPHATSKITDLVSLQTVGTLGFRGEALSSISSISQLTLRSRMKGSSKGWMVESEYGKLSDSIPTGMPEGTQIIVKNLFHTLPARKKFLRSTSTELRLITDIVITYALFHPEIRFFLKHNGKIVLDLPTHKQVDRFKNIFGDTLHSHLFPIVFDETYIKAEGFLAHPQAANKTPKYYLYINNRSVEDKLILAAVRESYRTLIEKNTHPFFILHLTIPPEMVDVNIHPRKEHVAFMDPVTLYAILEKEVRRVLSEQNITFHSLTWKDTPLTRSETGVSLKEELFQSMGDVLGSVNSTKLVQLHRLFIIFETKEGIMLVDQHAAHERILFEKYKALLTKKTKKSINLPEPLSYDFSLSDSQILEEYKQLFSDLGYEIEVFHDSTYLITQIPHLLQGFDHFQLIQEYLDEIRSTGMAPKTDSQQESMLAFLSCKAAVKAGDILDEEQMKDLITQLEDAPNNTTCPHGRPTKILLSVKELYKMFKR